MCGSFLASSRTTTGGEQVGDIHALMGGTYGTLLCSHHWAESVSDALSVLPISAQLLVVHAYINVATDWHLALDNARACVWSVLQACAQVSTLGCVWTAHAMLTMGKDQMLTMSKVQFGTGSQWGRRGALCICTYVHPSVFYPQAVFSMSCPRSGATMS